MTVKIDKAGRIVLPKATRDRLGLRAGTELDIVENGGGVTLKPSHPEPALKKKGRWWVLTGKLPEGWDFRKELDDMYEERARRLLGL